MSVSQTGLEDFLAVAESGSLTAAAARRNITVSGLSRRLASLENWAGCALIHRERRPVELTAAGVLFHDVAANIVASLNEAKSALGREETTDSVLTFVLPHTLRDVFFPHFVVKFQEAGFPFESQVISATEAKRLRKIHETGVCDFALYYNKPERPFELSTGHAAARLKQEHLLPVSLSDPDGRPIHPVPGRADQYTPHLNQGPGSYFMQLVRDLMAEYGGPCFLKPLPHTEGAVPFVEQVREGTGMAWLPRHLVQDDLVSGRLVVAGDEHWVIGMEICLARSARPLTASGEKLWELTLEMDFDS